MRHPILGISSLCAVAGLCQAQNDKVIPAVFATTEGNDLGTYPFGRPTCRSQQIWHGSSLASTTALISSMAYRPDNDNSTGSGLTTYGSVIVDVSTTTVSPAAMATTFGMNVTGTPTNVFNGPLALPPYTSTTMGIAPWAVSIPFSTPFVLQVANGHLLVDITTASPTPASPTYFMDVCLPGGSTRVVGTTGPTSGSFDQLRLTVSANGTGLDTTRYSGLIPGGQVTLITQAGRAFNGQWMLGPRLASPLDLALIGAPGNFLYVDPLVTSPFALSSGIGGYRATLALPIPADNGLIGGRLSAQSFVADAPANTLGYVTTNAYELTVGQPGTHPTQQLNSATPASPTGNFQYLTSALGGPVVKFTGAFQ